MPGTTVILGQAVGGTIKLWQALTVLVSIMLVVLGAYGTLILQNRSRVGTLRQRLFGVEGDETDEGFVQETERRLDRLAEKQEQHAQQTHTQLYKLDRKMSVVLDVVSEEHEDLRIPNTVEDVEDVPPPPGDFYRGGGSANGHDRRPGGDSPPATDDD